MVLFSSSARVGAQIFLIGVFFCLNAAPLNAAPITAIAAEVSVPTLEEARYRIYWNGIRLGKLWFYWKEDGERYEAKVKIQTSGVARVFSKQDRGASVKGRMARRDGLEYYFPENYEYSSKGKRKTREVAIAYNEEAWVKEFSVNPPDDPTRRPPVEEKARDAAYDPMTALRAILHYTQNLSQGGLDASSNFMVFDGRRLTRIVAVTGGPKSCGRGCVVARGSRELLEGYTDEEKEEFKQEKEAPVEMEIFPALSRFPQKIHTQTPLGEVYAKRY